LPAVLGPGEAESLGTARESGARPRLSAVATSGGLENNESVGARLRRRRLELGLTQRDLSEPGISYAYISRLESDARTPSVKALRKLAPKLQTSVSWLETGREDPGRELAALVLEHEGKPLPAAAKRLARGVLKELR
jgi:transcriptional regulator with XRE-family HTH domain